MTRPFRFGVVAPVQTGIPAWRDRVRRIADRGYSTLLMPDVPQWQPAPGPTLAMAAARSARPGTSPGRRARSRCSPKAASRWASAPAGPASKTNSASSGSPCYHRASGWLRSVRP